MMEIITVFASNIPDWGPVAGIMVGIMTVVLAAIASAAAVNQAATAAYPSEGRAFVVIGLCIPVIVATVTMATWIGVDYGMFAGSIIGFLTLVGGIASVWLLGLIADLIFP